MDDAGRRRAAALLAPPIVLPLIALTSLEVGYAWSYAGCGAETRWQLAAIAIAPAIASAVIGWAVWRAVSLRGGDVAEEPWPRWLAWASVATAGYITLVGISFVIPVIGLELCR